ncbi:MAG: hypothetical protein Q9225_008093, partial [Loekoesia sp. 1 TL-2023]
KIKGVVTFVKAIRNDSEDDHPSRPLIRHQNPRLNDPGVAPAPPLPPRIVLGLINKDAELRKPHGRGRQLMKPLRFGYGPAAKRLDNGKLRAVAIPTKEQNTSDPKGPIPLTAGNAGQTIVLSRKPQTNIAATNFLASQKFTDTRQSMASGNSDSSRRRRIPSLPRIPHQRMHFVTSLGSGGEGRCDLFRLHNRPNTLLVVKTLKELPNVVWYKNIKRKPIEAHILQDLLPPHPRIVRLHDFTYSPLTTKFFYEYCDLGDLQDVIDNYFDREAKIPEGFIWHAFSHLAEA